jgi:hypothetical protein
VGSKKAERQIHLKTGEQISIYFLVSSVMKALVLRFTNYDQVDLLFFPQSIGSPALVTCALIVKRSTKG